MSKVRFTAIPPEAFSDDKLSAVDFRVLGIVAGYDRLSKNGRGCFAAYGTIAADAKCDISSVKRALKRLRLSGYIKSEKGEADARSRVHRVVYAEIGGKSDTDQPLDRSQIDTELGGNASENIVAVHDLNMGKHNSKHIVLNEEENAAEAASFLRNDAPLSGSAMTSENGTGRNSGEVAGAIEGARVASVGEYLAKLDRCIRRDTAFTSEQFLANYLALDEIMNSYGDQHEGGIGGWAYRLKDEIALRMDEEAWSLVEKARAA